MPDLWNDPAHAQEVTSALSGMQAELRRVETLSSRMADLPVMFELAEAEDDADALAEAQAELEQPAYRGGVARGADAAVGEYDQREALVSIRSGAGGWTLPTGRRCCCACTRGTCEAKGWPFEVFDTSYAEEAGIKSATFKVAAPFAYGTLSIEQGTHRLVRISPSTTRDGARPPSRRWRCFRGGAHGVVGHPGRRVAHRRTGRPARVGRASTPPTRRSASRTCRPASW